MAHTKETLCNLALSKIGNELMQIEDFDDDTGKVARQCRLHYDPALSELVRMHPWNCTKRSIEAETTATEDYDEDDDEPVPSIPSGYSRYYELPASCVRVLGAYADGRHFKRLKQETEWTLNQRFLLTDRENVFLEYIAVPEPDEMDSLFAAAFYVLLASKLAIPLSGDREIYSDLMAEFMNVVLPEARRVNAFEKNEPEVIGSDWLDATHTPFLASGIGRTFPDASYGTLTY